MACPTCGFDISSGVCPVCGTNVGNNRAEVSQQPVAPEQPISPQQPPLPVNVMGQPMNNKPQKSSNGKVILIIVLAVVIVALAVAAFFLLRDEGGEPDPDPTHTVEPVPDSESIIGDWEGSLDITDIMNGEESNDYSELHYTDFFVPVIFSFDDDQSLVVDFDDSKDDEFQNDVEEIYRNVCRQSIELLADKEGMDVDEYVEASGFDSIEDIIDKIMNTGVDVDKTIETCKELYMSGYYKVSGNKIYIADYEDDLDDSDEYFTFKIKGSKLTLESYSGDSDDFGSFPITLTKS